MKITIKNTSKTVMVDDVITRLWEGTTENGTIVYALIARVFHDKDLDKDKVNEFSKDLKQVDPPSLPMISFPTRLIL